MSKLITLIILFFVFIITCIYQTAYAANDLKKWNSEQGQLVRQKAQQKLKTTTYREVDSFQVKDARVVSPQKINKQIGLNVDNNGSKAGVTIDALKDKNVASTAQKWGKELGKGAVRFTAGAFLVEAGVQAMLDSVDWLLDPANNAIRRKPLIDDYDDGTLSQTYQYKCRRGGSPVVDTVKECGQIFRDDMFKAYPKIIVQSCTVKSASDIYCTFAENGKALDNYQVADRVNRVRPFPEAPEGEIVSESDVIKTIEDYLNDSETPQNIKDIFHEEAEKPSGKGKIMWSDDPSSAVEIFADDKDLVDDILKSNDPVGDGLTDKVPDITSGTETEGDTTPKENPESEFITDPVTGDKIPNPNYNPNYDAGSSFKFELPAFCDYASIVCDWIDWTKEEPKTDEEEVSEVHIEEIDITDFEKEDHVSFGAYCPFKKEFESWNMGILGVFRFEYDLSFFCDFGYQSKATILGVGHLGALIFLLIGIRSGSIG